MDEVDVPEVHCGVWHHHTCPFDWNLGIREESITGSSVSPTLLTHSSVDLFMHVLGEQIVKEFISKYPSRYTSKEKVMVWLGMRILLMARKGNMGNKGKLNVLRNDVVALRKEISSRLGLQPSPKGYLIPGSDLFLRSMKVCTITSTHMKSILFPTMMELIKIGSVIGIECYNPKFGGRYPYERCYVHHVEDIEMMSIGISLVGKLYPILLGYIDTLPNEGIGYCHQVFSTSPPKVYYLHPRMNVPLCRGYCQQNGIYYVGRLRSKPPSYPTHPSHLITTYYNASSKEGITRIQQGKGDEYYVSNAFQPMLHAVDHPIVLEPSFSTHPCQEFHELLNGCWWPYSRKGYTHQLDSLFFSTLLLNCYHIWKAMHHPSSQPFPHPHDFYEHLGWELIHTFSSTSGHF